MTTEHDDGERDAAETLRGIDAPRPLPAELVEELTSLLTPRDPIAALADESDASVAVPDDLGDRLRATSGPPLPGDLHDRLTAALSTPTTAARPRSWRVSTSVLRVAAVVVAVLLVAGGLAFAASRDGEDDIALDTTAPSSLGAGVDRLPGPGEADDSTATTTPAAVVEATPTTAATGPATTTKPRVDRPAKVPTPTGAGHLVAYDSCDDLLGRTKDAALAVVGPYGLGGGPLQEATFERTAGPAPAAANAEAGGDGAGGGGEADVASSGTNVQEEGVDEPDIVKSDGRRIVVLTNTTLRVLRADGGRLTPAGELTLPQGAGAGELLVSGDHALVFGQTYEPQPQPQPAPADDRAAGSQRAFAPYPYRPPRATVWSIDLRNPSALRIESTLLLDGTVAAARLADGRVRLAVTSTSLGPEWVYPSDGTEDARQRALEENRRRVRESTLNDWTPAYTLLEGTSESTARHGRLCACDDTLRPQVEFGGASTVSVLTLDPSRPTVAPTGSAAVQGWAETVYASRANLFVTTRAFTIDRASAPTAVHRFDLGDPSVAVYRGSGEVRGAPLNQFSFSERGGVLRAATTDRAADGSGTESFVTTLAIRDDRLEPLGQVGNLGKGERIYAVRFLDAVGYVVTFRQTDPLYTVDLADPAKPRVVGELKIPGFSAYLHPVGDGRLVGVGQDANETGRATGAQVSSFDVRAPDAPKAVGRVSYGTNSSSEVQSDHHAFLWWAASRRAMVPVTRYEQQGDAYRQSSWVSVVDVDADGRLGEAGRVSHDGRAASPTVAIRRSFVIGDTLYTLSSAGVLASDLTTLADRSWLAFG